MTMEFPEFRNDDEMAAWFEKNDVSAADLEVAEDVTISPSLTVTLVAEVYSVRQPASMAANAAVTTAGRRDLTLSA